MLKGIAVTIGMLTATLIVVLPGRAESRPNIVIILCDDLGWGDLGCYGHPHIRTPRLDRLAGEGIRFTSFYSAAPVCSPSRVGFMTGRNPCRAGIYDWIPQANPRNGTPLNRQLVHMRAEEITLPKLLRQAGYATAMAGKWHCNAAFNHPSQPQPGDAGFDHWMATQNNAHPSHENPDNYVRNGKRVGPMQGYSCRLAAAEGIAWVDSHVRRQPDQPFFLYLPFHEPHEPVKSPPDLVAGYKAVARNEDEAEYFANIENVDLAVGDVLDALDRLKVADNTLVLFSSDNGPETLKRYPAGQRCYGSPGPLRGMKLWTTDGGFRVPGIVRWPGHALAGTTCDEPVSSLDLLPTLTALAEAKIPPSLTLDGTNIAAALHGREFQRSKPLFWIYYNALNEQRVALRDGPWKLLARLDGGQFPRTENITASTAPAARAAKLTDFSLYRIQDDVSESKDLSQLEPRQLAELTVKMEALYRELTTTMHVWPDSP